MRKLEQDTLQQTTEELIADAIEGIQYKIGKLHVAAYQQQTKDGLGKVIAAQSEIIQNAINTLREIKGRL